MKCVECSYFKRLYKPIGTVTTGIWDFGKCKCEKHDLYVEYASERKLNRMKCVEEEKPNECPKD